MTDPEVRVRHFASEALYNVAKVARNAIIPLFPKIFASLSRLVTDPDENCKNGSELLDRLLKVIILPLIHIEMAIKYSILRFLGHRN